MVVRVLANDEVVEEADVHELGCICDALRDRAICNARRRVARGVIMR